MIRVSELRHSTRARFSSRLATLHKSFGGVGVFYLFVLLGFLGSAVQASGSTLADELGTQQTVSDEPASGTDAADTELRIEIVPTEPEFDSQSTDDDVSRTIDEPVAEEQQSEASLLPDELSTDGLLVDELNGESEAIGVEADCLASEQDEIWLVSSRSIGCPACDDSGLRYQERRDCTWVTSDRTRFDQSLQATMQTVVFVHGNRTDLNYAVRRGLQAYRSFISESPRIAPIRFVIWAWPSEQESVGLRDFRMKADRADLEGCLFGTFLSRLPADQQLNLIAYSYGSRIVLGGVSMLSGHELWGRRVSLPEGYTPPPLRVTLIAAAAPPSSLLPGAHYAPAYGLIDRLVLINNREDRALKLYRIVDRTTSSVAMGSLGLSTRRLPDAGARVAQWDVSRHVGPQHKIDLYFGSSVVGRLVRDQVAWVTHDGSDSETVGLGGSSGRR